MNFVYAWRDAELATFPLGLDLFEAFLNGGKLLLGENADLRIAASVSNTLTNILCIDSAIKVD